MKARTSEGINVKTNANKRQGATVPLTFTALLLIALWPLTSNARGIGSYPISTPNFGYVIAHNSTNGYMYVSHDEGVYVLDDKKIIAEIPLTDNPLAFAHNPSNGLMYAVLEDSVQIIDGFGVTDSVNITSNILSPVDIVFNPANGYIYISNGIDAVKVVNGATIIADISINGPRCMAYNPGNGHIYVGSGASAVSVIDDVNVIATIPMPAPSTVSIAYNSNNGFMYALSMLTGTVKSTYATVIDGTSNVENIYLSITSGGTLVHNSANGYMYALVSTWLYILDGTSKLAFIDVGPQITSIDHNPANGYVYVVSNLAQEDTVAVIKDTTIISRFNTGWYPGKIAYNPSNQDMYMVNGFTKTIWQLGEPHRITSGMNYELGPYAYEVLSTIEVDANAILDIAGGAQLAFLEDSGIIVEGTLNINGMEENHVVLNSAEDSPIPDAWSGIVFQEGSHGMINFAYIAYGGGGPETANVTLHSGNVTIENCRISNAANHGIYVTDNAQPIIHHNSVTDNPRGIYCDLNASPDISNNSISNNTYGLYCNTSGNPVVYLNDICGNTVFGMFNTGAVLNIAATQNWWGDCSGPYHLATNPTGIGNQVSDFVSFTPWICKPAPEVHVVTPDSGSPGDIVTIQGSHFFEGIRDNQLTFGGIASSMIYSWSDTRIVAQVPPTATGPVVVTTAVGASNDDIVFTELDNTLILSLPMEDDGCGVTSDLSENGNDGTVNGAVFVPGQGLLGSNAYLFDWTASNSIQVAYQTSQIATEALSLEAWVYPTAWDNIYAGNNRILSKQPVYLLRAIDGRAHFQILTATHGYQGISDNQPMALNQWHYVVGTFDGSTLRLYVDGSLRQALSLPEQDTLINNENDIYIGEFPHLAEGFSGAIDNVVIHKRSRSQSEVHATYASVVPLCKGDFNGDKTVNETDLAMLADYFGRTNCTLTDPCFGDIFPDGDIDGADVALFTKEFGRTNCP